MNKFVPNPNTYTSFQGKYSEQNDVRDHISFGKFRHGHKLNRGVRAYKSEKSGEQAGCSPCPLGLPSSDKIVKAQGCKTVQFLLTSYLLNSCRVMDILKNNSVKDEKHGEQS